MVILDQLIGSIDTLSAIFLDELANIVGVLLGLVIAQLISILKDSLEMLLKIGILFYQAKFDDIVDQIFGINQAKQLFGFNTDTL